MRDNIRCLHCGSSRFAIFRVNDQLHENNRASPKPQKIDYRLDYDMFKATEEFKKLMDGDVDNVPKSGNEHTVESSAEPKDEIKTAQSVEEMVKPLSSPKLGSASAYNKNKSFFDTLSTTDPNQNGGRFNQRVGQFGRPTQRFGQYESSRNQDAFDRGGFGAYQYSNNPGMNRNYHRPQGNQYSSMRSRDQQTFGPTAMAPQKIPTFAGNNRYAPRNWENDYDEFDGGADF